VGYNIKAMQSDQYSPMSEVQLCEDVLVANPLCGPSLKQKTGRNI